MSMHVNLSPEIEGFIKSKVEGGFYGNATEVIRDALRRLQAEDARLEAWNAAIALGDDDIERGETIVYDAQALQSITDDAMAELHDGVPVDPDVAA